ncbi:MAG: putative secreted protein [Myxococcales bacterium]|nr:putative secreted protein [Myxococcales bacterium]
MNRLVVTLTAFTVAITVALLGTTARAATEPPADLVLRNGDVLTQDPAHPHARAVAVRGDQIVAVGDDAAVAALVGAGTRVIDLHGRAVVPALTDAHAHLSGLGFALAEVDLRGVASAAECARRAAAAAEKSSRPWIIGRGWDQNRFADKAFPTHAALDHIARPVFFERIDGHAGWANAEAMKRAGITRATTDPAGGRIVRDAAGEPTGIFVDNAMSLVDHAIPTATDAEIEAAILRAQEVVAAQGLTGIHDMGVGLGTLAVYHRLAAAGRLKIRVYALGSAADADTLLAQPPAKSAPRAMLSVRGIKLYADGALGSRGAALLAPYSDDAKNSGLEIMPAATIEALSRRAVAAGWQVAIHAIGDRGNRNALDAFMRAGVKPAQRFRIEHAQVVALGDIPRFAKLGLIASMQPTHATSDSPWAEARLGKERVKGAYAWRRMLEAHVPLAFGSDFPVEEPSLVAGLRAGVERAGWTVDQKLTLDETLRAFTTGAAYAAFEEAWRGRAAPGMAADLTIFDSPAATLTRARVDVTIVGGKVIYERK